MLRLVGVESPKDYYHHPNGIVYTLFKLLSADSINNV